MAKITREEIENIALLSKLNVQEDEIDALTEEMAKIIDFADTINNAASAGEEFDNINNLSNRFHEDEVRESYPQEDILKNVDGGVDGFFYIRKKEQA